jgi:hypothetical protein
MPIVIDFEWTVDAKGYRLERGRIIGQGGTKRRMRLKDFSKLYLEFAKAQTPEGLLDFVNRFGRLTPDKVKMGQDGPEVERQGDDVRFVLGRAKMISMMLEMLRGQIGNPPKWQGGPFEYEAAGFKVIGGIPIPARLGASLAPDPMTGALQLKLLPPTLLDAIWLQLGQALTSNADLKQCGHCLTWFEAGVGTGRRADAKFCSDKCRIDHKSLERTRKKRSR